MRWPVNARSVKRKFKFRYVEGRDSSRGHEMNLLYETLSSRASFVSINLEGSKETMVVGEHR